MKKVLVIVLAMSIAAIAIPVFAECWTAMAVHSSRGTVGIGTGPTLSEAMLNAKQKAGTPGSPIWIWGLNQNLAMAVDASNPATFGMSQGLDQADADRKAIAFCKEMGGRNCKITARGGCGTDNNPQGGGWQQSSQ
jgi:hypothetical protein